MALQIWLPLNKDLRNTGLNNISPTGSDFSIISEGVFLNCLKTGQSAISIGLNGNLINENSISFGGFFKFNKSEIENVLNGKSYTSTNKSSCGCLIGNNSYQGISLHWWSNDMYTNGNFSSMTVIASLRTPSLSLVRTTSFSVIFDAWTHFFLTFDKEKKQLKFYVNGELFNTKTFNDFSDAPSRILYINYPVCDGGNALPSCIPFCTNDIRIYDNCLSEDDVKRIYQQKLFEFYPKENRKNYLSYANVNGAFGWSSYGFGSKGIGEVTNEVVAAYTTNSQNIRNGNTDNVIKITTSYSGNSTNPSEMARWVDCIPIADNECVTFSFYAKGDGTSVGRIIRVHVYGTKSGDSSTNLSTGSDYRLTSNWKRYSHVFKWDKGGTSTGRYSCYMAPYIAKDEHVYVCNFQLEEGSGTTTYNNASARNLMFDKAGFSLKNDLVCSGVTFSGNTAIFNGTSDIIKSKTAGLSISGGTLSVWFFIETKPSTSQLIYLDGNNRMAFGLYNNASVIIVSTKTSSPTYPASSVIYGSWNHAVITYGTNYVATNCYLNGVKLTSSGSDYWSNGNLFLEIGGRVYYSQYFKGSIKNIKIFKKQLSEEEILELYRQNGN